MPSGEFFTKRLSVWLVDVPLIIGVSLLLFFRGIGDTPFYDKAEAREALVIWEIHKSGDWILPLRNGEEIPAKPPFYHWLGALASTPVDRVDELTSRLPSAVLGLVGILLTYATGAVLWGRGAGLIAALVLSTSFEWRTARAARVDMALTFVLLCSFLFFLYLYRTGSSRAKATVFGFFVGLAILAKGPLGFVLPYFTVLIFLWSNKDLAFLKKFHSFTALSVCALVAGSWYLLALWQGGQEFLTMVIKENVNTVVGKEAGHPHPFWWYIPYLFQHMAPWSLFFPSIAVFLYRYRRKLAEENLLYLIVWFATVFIFFSIFKQKRTVYILSAYPAVALLFGAWWQKLKDGTLPNEPLFITRLAAYLNAGSFLIMAVLLILQVTNRNPLAYLNPMLGPKDVADMTRVAGLLTEHRITILLWSVVCGLGGILLVLSARKRAWGAFMGGTAAVMVISLNNVQTFDTALAKEYSIKPFMNRVVSVVKNAPLFFYESEDYPVMFYAGRHIHQYKPPLKIASSPYYVLFWENEWKPIRQNEGLIVRATSQSTDRIDPNRAHLVLVEVKTPDALPSSAQSAEIEPTSLGN